jgi:hypothetical protein
MNLIENLYKKEIAFKLNTDKNIASLSKYLIYPEKAKSFLVKIFLSTFYMYDLDLDHEKYVKKQINVFLYIYKHNFFKKTPEMCSEIFNLIDSYKKIKIENIDDVNIDYCDTSEKLLIKYIYNNHLFEDNIFIPARTYKRILNFTREKSILHTNLIFLRYLYGLNFAGQNYAALNFKTIRESNYKLECFASSFNRYSDYFCALYNDIDIYSEGYLGNFFNLTVEDLIEKINWYDNTIKLTFNPPFVYFLMIFSFKKLYDLMYECYFIHKFDFEVNIDLPTYISSFIKPILEKFSVFANIDYHYLSNQDYSYVDRVSNKEIIGPTYIFPMKMIIKSKKINYKKSLANCKNISKIKEL